MVEERISEHKDTFVESAKTGRKKKKERETEKKNRFLKKNRRRAEYCKKFNTYTTGIPEEERKQ